MTEPLKFDVDLYQKKLIEKDDNITVAIQNLIVYVDKFDKDPPHEIYQALLAEREGVRAALFWLDSHYRLEKQGNEK
jgi:hypothetical protein